MNELEELYKEVILDHAKRPRNFGKMKGATVVVESENPLCGDELTLYLKTKEDGKEIEASGFVGQACAICTASASMLTTKVKRISTDAAGELAEEFLGMLKRPLDAPAADLNGKLGGLAVLDGVRQFPMRVKCASLAWHALEQAIEQARNGGDSSGVQEEGEPG